MCLNAAQNTRNVLSRLVCQLSQPLVPEIRRLRISYLKGLSAGKYFAQTISTIPYTKTQRPHSIGTWTLLVIHTACKPGVQTS